MESCPPLEMALAFGFGFCGFRFWFQRFLWFHILLCCSLDVCFLLCVCVSVFILAIKCMRRRWRMATMALMAALGS